MEMAEDRRSRATPQSRAGSYLLLALVTLLSFVTAHVVIDRFRAGSGTHRLGSHPATTRTDAAQCADEIAAVAALLAPAQAKRLCDFHRDQQKRIAQLEATISRLTSAHVPFHRAPPAP